MTVSVAEYLGISVTSDIKISPVDVSDRPRIPCPFRNSHCDKAVRGNKPVCSVRQHPSGELWIVCAHRLCSTQPRVTGLTNYQQGVLFGVAQAIYGKHVTSERVLFKREVKIAASDASNYFADYVLWLKEPRQTDSPVVLEMQGGGETTNTGALTKHITAWEKTEKPTNAFLAQPVANVSPLETNAWRRQQEQFLIKGNVAVQSSGKMVFCMGSMIFDYLMPKLQQVRLQDLRKANWTLALLAIKEGKAVGENSLGSPPTHAIPLEIDSRKVLFTNYNSFVQALTNQSIPDEKIFTEGFTSLTGEPFTVLTEGDES